MFTWMGPQISSLGYFVCGKKNISLCLLERVKNILFRLFISEGNDKKRAKCLHVLRSQAWELVSWWYFPQKFISSHSSGRKFFLQQPEIFPLTLFLYVLSRRNFCLSSCQKFFPLTFGISSRFKWVKRLPLSVKNIHFKFFFMYRGRNYVIQGVRNFPIAFFQESKIFNR